MTLAEQVNKLSHQFKDSENTFKKRIAGFFGLGTKSESEITEILKQLNISSDYDQSLNIIKEMQEVPLIYGRKLAQFSDMVTVYKGFRLKKIEDKEGNTRYGIEKLRVYDDEVLGVMLGARLLF